MIRTPALFGAVIALALVAAAILGGVGLHELRYASEHPYQYGPAKVIATAAFASALIAVAVGSLAAALLRQLQSSR